MKVTFHLRRRRTPSQASAVLIDPDRVEWMLGLAKGWNQGPPPEFYRVAGGILLKLGPEVIPPAGPIRLRKLAENLYVPADADLIPALLDDEAAGLTRDLGLVVLPGGRILGFDPASPLPISSLIDVTRLQGSTWRSFPPRPDRPDRVREITFEPPQGTIEDPFPTEEGSNEIGTEDPPRPEQVGPASTLAGRASLELAKGLFRLGSLLGIKAMAEMSAHWIARAVEKAPRLTEAMLGRQEGALRELLRQFREGDVDQALRHALPLGGQADRGGFASVEGKLPTVDPTYSLQSLLGQGQGSSGIWFGAFDVQTELIREYRKAAEDAERQGDYKRAAYILGKLLNDYSTAAHLLSKGGFHRDAAILYLNKVKDIPAAARAFEAAGEVDRALLLYRRKGMHLEAADLLRKLGEDDAAVEEYQRAAEALTVNTKAGMLAAGDLLRDRAGRPDLATLYYARGWADRPAAWALACGLRMASDHADRGQVLLLFELVSEADEYLLPPGQEGPATEFYNAVASLANREAMSEARDDLRDRALMGLAAKLRQSSASTDRPGLMTSNYLGRSGTWPPELVSDANQALRSLAERETQRRRLSGLITARTSVGEARRIAVHGGIVSAVCHAPASGEVFLGFETGEVFRIEIARGIVTQVAAERVPIHSISVDFEGRTLVILLEHGVINRQLIYRSRVANSNAWSRQSRTVDGAGPFWLTPITTTGAGRYQTLGVWNGEELLLMGGVGSLTLLQRLPMTFLKNEPHAALLIPPRGRDPILGTVLIHDEDDVCHADVQGRVLRRRLIGWRPTLPEGNTLRSVPLSWLQVDPEQVELVGLDREGVVHWTSLKITDAELIRTSNNISSGQTVYTATTLVRSGLVAGVGESGIDWLRAGPQSFREVSSTGPGISGVVSCVASAPTSELVLVQGDGTLVCFPTPR